DREADALSLGIENLVGIGETGGKGVDENVAIVAGIELDFATNHRHAEGVAVTADAGNDARNQMPGFFVLGSPEAEGVHRRDWPGAHGEDVAQDAPDASCRTLVGLDE